VVLVCKRWSTLCLANPPQDKLLQISLSPPCDASIFTHMAKLGKTGEEVVTQIYLDHQCTYTDVAHLSGANGTFFRSGIILIMGFGRKARGGCRAVSDVHCSIFVVICNGNFWMGMWLESVREGVGGGRRRGCDLHSIVGEFKLC